MSRHHRLGSLHRIVRLVVVLCVWLCLATVLGARGEECATYTARFNDQPARTHSPAETQCPPQTWTVYTDHIRAGEHITVVVQLPKTQHETATEAQVHTSRFQLWLGQHRVHRPQTHMRRCAGVHYVELRARVTQAGTHEIRVQRGDGVDLCHAGPNHAVVHPGPVHVGMTSLVHEMARDAIQSAPALILRDRYGNIAHSSELESMDVSVRCELVEADGTRHALVAQRNSSPLRPLACPSANGPCRRAQRHPHTLHVYTLYSRPNQHISGSPLAMPGDDHTDAHQEEAAVEGRRALPSSQAPSSPHRASHTSISLQTNQRMRAMGDMSTDSSPGVQRPRDDDYDDNNNNMGGGGPLCPSNAQYQKHSNSCECNPGFYTRASSNGNFAFQCSRCPLGAVCAGGQSPPVSAAGYRQQTGNELRFFRCYPAQACLGANQCAPGYTGPQCLACAGNYFRELTRCVPCPELQYDTHLFGLALSLTALLVLFVWHVRVSAVRGTLLLTVRKTHEFLHFCVLLTLIEHDWPSSVYRRFQWLYTVITLQTNSALSLQCSPSNWTPFQLWLIATVTPLLSIIVSMFISIVFSYRDRFFFSIMHAARVGALLLFLIYPYWVLQGLKVFQCTAVDGMPTTRLIMFPQVSCRFDDATWGALVPWALLLLLVTGVVLPYLLYTVYTRRASWWHARDMQRVSAVDFVLGWLWYPFTENHSRWSLLPWLTRAMFLFVVMFIQQSILVTVLTAAQILLYVYVQHSVSPYSVELLPRTKTISRRTALQVLEYAHQGIFIFIMGLGFLYGATDDMAAEGTITTFIVIAVTSGVVLSIIYPVLTRRSFVLLSLKMCVKVGLAPYLKPSHDPMFPQRHYIDVNDPTVDLFYLLATTPATSVIFLAHGFTRMDIARLLASWMQSPVFGDDGSMGFRMEALHSSKLPQSNPFSAAESSRGVSRASTRSASSLSHLKAWMGRGRVMPRDEMLSPEDADSVDDMMTFDTDEEDPTQGYRLFICNPFVHVTIMDRLLMDLLDPLARLYGRRNATLKHLRVTSVQEEPMRMASSYVHRRALMTQPRLVRLLNKVNRRTNRRSHPSLVTLDGLLNSEVVSTELNVIGCYQGGTQRARQFHRSKSLEGLDGYVGDDDEHLHHDGVGGVGIVPPAPNLSTNMPGHSPPSSRRTLGGGGITRLQAILDADGADGEEEEDEHEMGEQGTQGAAAGGDNMVMVRNTRHGRPKRNMVALSAANRQRIKRQTSATSGSEGSDSGESGEAVGM